MYQFKMMIVYLLDYKYILYYKLFRYFATGAKKIDRLFYKWPEIVILLN